MSLTASWSQSEGVDRYAVCCNFVQSTKTAYKGTKAYVLLPNYGNASERICIRYISRGKHWITKWEDLRRLGNFRRKTIPPEHPMYRAIEVWDDVSWLDRLIEVGGSNV